MLMVLIVGIFINIVIISLFLIFFRVLILVYVILGIVIKFFFLVEGWIFVRVIMKLFNLIYSFCICFFERGFWFFSNFNSFCNLFFKDKS